MVSNPESTSLHFRVVAVENQMCCCGSSINPAVRCTVNNPREEGQAHCKLLCRDTRVGKHSEAKYKHLVNVGLLSLHCACFLQMRP